jgi:arylsulfatase A-like enzyme
MMSDYYGLVKEVDDWVGKILDKLAALGLEDNTLVIFTSDHGEMLGSHGMNSKTTFYEESVHVPLIMRFPAKIRPGSVVSTPVAHIDFFATILDYLDMPAHPSDGRSLRPLIEGRESGAPDYAISEWKARGVPNFMVRTEDWKLMIANQRESRAVDALYHLKEDPHERTNLIGANPNKAQYVAHAQAMKDRLVEWLRKTGSPHIEDVIAREL